MLHFKNLDAFTRRIQDGPNWADYFQLGGRMYELYEYGPGIGVDIGYHYAYFRNKRSNDMVYIKYHLPSVNWVKIPSLCEEDNKPHKFVKGGVDKGNMEYCLKCLRRERERVESGAYQLLGVELQENVNPWR